VKNDVPEVEFGIGYPLPENVTPGMNKKLGDGSEKPPACLPCNRPQNAANWKSSGF
jgi:hypothetical protein